MRCRSAVVNQMGDVFLKQIYFCVLNAQVFNAHNTMKMCFLETNT